LLKFIKTHICAVRNEIIRHMLFCENRNADCICIRSDIYVSLCESVIEYVVSQQAGKPFQVALYS